MRKNFWGTAHRPFCCCMAEGDLFTGDATRRKIRCLHEILRGVTGVPPAFRDSLLQVDEVLFLPSPSLQNVNKCVTGKEDTHFIERWGMQAIQKFCRRQAQGTGNMERGDTSALVSQSPQRGKTAIQATAQSQKVSCFYSFLRWQASPGSNLKNIGPCMRGTAKKWVCSLPRKQNWSFIPNTVSSLSSAQKELCLRLILGISKIASTLRDC